MMLSGAGSFAGNPETTKVLKPTYHISALPPSPSPNGYLYDCCHTSNLGWNLSHTCVSFIVECWGACAGHGWLVDVCTDGTTTIRGALMAADKPEKVEVPLFTGIIAENFDPTLDPASQVTEFRRIKNSLINLENPVIIETEGDVFVFAAGKYQIIDSKLMVLATKTQP